MVEDEEEFDLVVGEYTANNNQDIMISKAIFVYKIFTSNRRLY
ncbi:MAG: hypothetical protein RR409_17550 [Clostridium sp.]